MFTCLQRQHGRDGGVETRALAEVAAGAAGVLARACASEQDVIALHFADPALAWLRNQERTAVAQQQQHKQQQQQQRERDRRSSGGGSGGEARRYAAVLVLRELAVAAPTLMYDRRRAFFDDIWAVISDPQQAVR
jgi:hypothetical protein